MLWLLSIFHHIIRGFDGPGWTLHESDANELEIGRSARSVRYANGCFPSPRDRVTREWLNTCPSWSWISGCRPAQPFCSMAMSCYCLEGGARDVEMVHPFLVFYRESLCGFVWLMSKTSRRWFLMPPEGSLIDVGNVVVLFWLASVFFLLWSSGALIWVWILSTWKNTAAPIHTNTLHVSLFIKTLEFY